MTVTVNVDGSNSGDVTVNVNAGGANHTGFAPEIEDYADAYDCGCPVGVSTYRFGSAIKTSVITSGLATLGVASMGMAIVTLPVVASCVGATVFIGGSVMGAFTYYENGCSCSNEAIDTQLIDNKGAVNKALLLEMEKTNQGLKALEGAYKSLNDMQSKIEKTGKENEQLRTTIRAVEKAYIAREQSKQGDIVDTTVYAKQLAKI